jgi:uncharacterized membrane protein
MVSAALIGILALGHVLSAVGWLGGGLLTTFVLAPNMRKLQPAANMEFNAKVLPRIIRFVQVMIGTTLLFGILLLYFYYGSGLSSFMGTAQGMELSLGIALALVTAVMAWTVTFPSFNKVIKIANSVLQGGQPPPELMKYGQRARMGSMIGVALLLITLATMVFSGFGFY